MDENYLVALFVAFVFSFVVLKKDSPVSLADNEKPKTKQFSNESGSTGVAKYLSKQQGAGSQENVTGVARYLKEKQGLIEDNTESIAVSGVAKYLADRETEQATGVSKYMARQAVIAEKIAKENVSGVEKYLNRRG